MWRKVLWTMAIVASVAFLVVSQFRDGFTVPENFPVLEVEEIAAEQAAPTGATELATLGSGCFWCSEAVFQQMNGVSNVVAGYSGGHVPNPTTSQVNGESTGHAEVVQITFDPAVISYPELLEVFWRSHDPTTPNRQGHDTGPQYRSIIFTHSDAQKRLAERYKSKIDAFGVYSKPLVTEIVPFTAFYPAEAKHQHFFEENARQPYSRSVIRPKIDQLRKVFRDRLKDE